MDNFAVIILAAGQSSRLGHPKQLVEINNQSLLVRQSALALSFTEHVYCVLGFQSELMQQPLAALPVNIVINPQWEQGMSSSINSAMQVLPKSIESVMIVLVDQWQLNKSRLTPLIDTFLKNKSNIVTSANTYLLSNAVNENNNKSKRLETGKTRIGPPTIFPKCYFSALSELSGEKGAKMLIVKEKKSVIQFNLPEAFIDLDNADDLSQLRRMYPN